MRTPETLTIGQSLDNHFSVPIEGLPTRFPIFSRGSRGYALHFTGAMTGRLSSGGSLRTLAQLKSSGATQRDDHWEIALDDHSRGKISIGPMTLLFQFVDAPPMSPAARLPASIQRSLVSRIEPKLALILACSVLMHFSVALYAYTRDQILKQPVERIAHSFQVGQYEMPEQTPYEPAVPDEAGAEAGASAELPAQETPRLKREPREARDKRVSKPEEGTGGDETSIAESIQKTALVSILTGKDGNEGLFQAMNNTDQGASLDSSLEHIKGVATVTQTDQPKRHRTNPTPTIGTGEKVEVDGPGPAATLTPKTEESVPRFEPGTPLSISDLDPAEVIKRIRGKYLSGIKRCHQRALKYDPRAKGRVAIRLTIGPTGRVTRANAKGFSSEVDTCITGQAARWRFSAPTDEGTRTSAEFEIPLLLKPGS